MLRCPASMSRVVMNHWGRTWAHKHLSKRGEIGSAPCVGVHSININLVSSLPTQVSWWWLSVDGPPRGDRPNYWPVNPRDLPLPAGWARGHGRSREWSPGTMSPKPAVGSNFRLVALLYRFFLLGVHARARLLSTFWAVPTVCCCFARPLPIVAASTC